MSIYIQQYAFFVICWPHGSYENDRKDEPINRLVGIRKIRDAHVVLDHSADLLFSLGFTCTHTVVNMEPYIYI